MKFKTALLCAALITSILTGATAFASETTDELTVKDGSVSFDFGFADGTSPWAEVSATSEYSPELGYGFSSTLGLTNVPAPGNGVLSDAIQFDFYGDYGPSFNVDVEPGLYEVSVYGGNINYLTIGLEGHYAILDIQFNNSEGKVEIPVTDNQLNITFHEGLDHNENSQCQVSAISVTRKGDISERRKRLFICGDSTAATYYPLVMPTPLEEGYRGGWGQMIENYISPSIYVHNMAQSGQTAKGFVESGQLSSTLFFMRPGDYAIVAYGINDYAECTKDEYVQYTKQIIEEILSRGATPILVSSNGWLTDFNSESPAHEYVYEDKSFIAETKELAEQYGITYINLHDISSTYFNYIGYDATESLYWITWSGDRDTIHPNRNGAGQLARMVVEELIRQGYIDFAYYIDGYGVSNDPRLKCNIDENNVLKLENTMPYNLTLNLIVNSYNEYGGLIGTTVTPVTVPHYDVLNPNTTTDIQLPSSHVRAFLVGYGINLNVFDTYNNYYDTPNNASLTFLP